MTTNIEAPRAASATPEKATRFTTGLSLLDDVGSPTPTCPSGSTGVKNADDSSACGSSVSDDAEKEGAVETAADLAKKWKADLEERNDQIKCLRLRNSKWLSVLCMIDPECGANEE
jgi:hypothetical protein